MQAVNYEKVPQSAPFEVAVVSQDERSSKGRRTRTNWKSGALACACAAGGVLVLNLVIVIWQEARTGFQSMGKANGKRVLYDGNCDTTKKLNTATHLLINVFSTILLGASNYCMQCMSAPTREDVDRAHAQSRWVDIGVPSVRNLRYVSKSRVLAWCFLGLSSLPLHLFYNSTVFFSLGAFPYEVFSANEAFAENPSDSAPIIRGSWEYHDGDRTISGKALLEDVDLNKLQMLGVNDCLTAYAQTYQTDYRNLFLVVSNSTPNYNSLDPVVEFEARDEPIDGNAIQNASPYSWICRNTDCDGPATATCETFIPCIQGDLGEWKPFKKGIEYCLSEKVSGHCQLAYSIHLIIVVLLIGSAKTALMLYIAFRFKERPLLTMGDAVSSYLQRPDAFTQRSCLVNRKEVQKSFRSQNMIGQRRQYRREPVRRFRAVSATRMAVLVVAFIVIFTVSVFLLRFGIDEASGRGSTSSLFKIGLGAVNSRTLITWEVPGKGVEGLVANVVVANSPQLVFSFLYLTYNGVATTMSLASEWSRFAIARKGLRVSMNPKDSQRSTYFLQLPFRIGIPLMVMCGTMHWLISQSLFLVSVDIYDLRDASKGTEPVEDSGYMTCGYSPVAMIATILVGLVSFLAILALGLRKLKSGMPVAGSCSAAIAAACQPGSMPYRPEEAYAKLQWGVMRSSYSSLEHCGFSMDDMEAPEDGKFYE